MYAISYYTNTSTTGLPWMSSSWHTFLKSESKSHCDWQSVSLGVKPHLGLIPRYLLLFDSYGVDFVGHPLWSEDGSVFCIFCWPLPVQFFSGLSPLGLSQIWDFPFHHLVRLAGSQWRYSTPPPQRLLILNSLHCSTGCFTTLGHNCRMWFPRSLWSKKFI
jgi:hypothetical protein